MQINLMKKLEVHYLGYYLNWVPQETYYYSVNNCGFRPRPFRTQGTYSKYNSIDDKIDDLHYFTTFIKFGIGELPMMHLKKLETITFQQKRKKNLSKNMMANFQIFTSEKSWNI